MLTRQPVDVSAWYNRLQSPVSSLVLVLAADHTIRLVNSATLPLLQCERSELRGHPLEVISMLGQQRPLPCWILARWRNHSMPNCDRRFRRSRRLHRSIAPLIGV